MKPKNYFSLANEMLLSALNEKDGVSSRAAAARFLRLGCKGLDQVLEDLKEPNGDLYWSMTHLQDVAQKTRTEYDSHISSAQTMLDTFFVAEANLLKSFKAPTSVQTFVMSQARDLMKDFDEYENLSSRSRKRIKQNVSELRDEVCSYSKQVENTEKARKLLKRSAYAGAGAGVIALNASADAITSFGLAPWMTAMSGELGSILMANSQSSTMLT